jgi:3-oxoacyl-[acyl-carrier-protein] synthase III
VRARIAGVATFLPERRLSSREAEERVGRESTGFVPRAVGLAGGVGLGVLFAEL